MKTLKRNKDDIILEMAKEITLWRKNFNKAEEEIEKLSGKKMLKVREDNENQIIESYKYYEK